MGRQGANQVQDISADDQAPLAVNDEMVDKAENGYFDMPTTPTATGKLGKFNLSIKRAHLRECLAEFLGTLVLILFGLGVNNQVTNSEEKSGTWLSGNIGWGIGILIGIYCSDGVSGGHINPAVTLTQAVYGRLAWWKVPGYMGSQLLGAFIGAFLIYLMQYQNLNVIDPDRMTTQSSFATYPRDNISNLTAFYSEFLATAVFLLGIFAITDKRNSSAGPVGTPFAIAVLFMGLGMAFGMNTGYAINPARDFGPRIFISMAGWGSKAFTLHNHYFWIPIIAPMWGGVVGAGTYRLLVEIHHPDEGEQ